MRGASNEAVATQLCWMYNSSQGGKISKYLAKKKLGGEINQRGNEYELYYACNLICQFTHSHPSEINNIFISSQAEASIDDLYVNYCNKTHHYYQLKTSKSLDWNARKITSTNKQGAKKRALPLKFDFWLQANWCRLNNQKYKLHLVVSEKKVQQQMSITKPILMPNVSVDLFLYDTTVTRLLFSNVEFRDNITSLCAIANPSLDTLAAVAFCIIGAWTCSGRKDISINDLLSKVKSTSGSFVKYPIFSNVKISPALHAILVAIPKFSYIAENDVFIWKYGVTDYGKSPYNISSAEFSEFEQKVIQSKPATYQALENLLILLS